MRHQPTLEELKRAERCADCHGSGEIVTPSLNPAYMCDTCPTCGGRGYIIPPRETEGGV